MILKPALKIKCKKEKDGRLNKSLYMCICVPMYLLKTSK